MNHLDLFSGIGGFALGLMRAGYNTVAFAEHDEYCQKVLQKNFPNVPIINEVEEVNGISADIITSGFPCQPYSRAHWKRAGKADHRDGTDETIRVVSESKPDWVICENVEGFIEIGLDAFLADLEEIGYQSQAFSLPSCIAGLPTLERHIWIISTPELQRLQRCVEATVFGIEGLQSKLQRSRPKFPERWANSASRTVRVGEGISTSVDRDRIKVLGNAVDPHIPQIIGEAIMGSI